MTGCASEKFTPTLPVEQAPSLEEGLILCNEYRLPPNAKRTAALSPYLKCVDELAERHPEPSNVAFARFRDELHLIYHALGDVKWSETRGYQLETAIHALFRALWRKGVPNFEPDATSKEQAWVLRYFPRTAKALHAPSWKISDKITMDPGLEKLKAGAASLVVPREQTSQAPIQKTAEICGQLSALFGKIGYLSSLWRDQVEIAFLHQSTAAPHAEYEKNLDEARGLVEDLRSKIQEAHGDGGFNFAACDARKRTPSSVIKHAPALSLRAVYQPSKVPLTTEEIWVLDPDERNPAHQRWELDRRLKLEGLSSRPIGKSRYGVRTGELLVYTQSFLRGPGSWYRPWDEFPCGSKIPDSRFSNLSGARKAADAAAQAWEEILDEGREELDLRLSHVTASSGKRALEDAQSIYGEWLVKMNRRWEVEGHAAAEHAEWRFYRSYVASAHLCSRPAFMRKPLPSWSAMLEGLAPHESKTFLARAPAKRWNGAFSVRLNLELAGVVLDGQFLIDSQAKRSMISPSWLTSQGVIPSALEELGVPPQAIVWDSASGLARVAKITRMRLGDYELPLKEFLLVDTSTLFEPPETAATCCDGVLGSDFLRLFSVEFKPGKPNEIVLYDRHGFQFSADTPWTEVSLNDRGEPVSACVETSRQTRLQGALWDTGSETALDIHFPWQKPAKRAGSRWNVSCPPLEVAKGVDASETSNPATTIGMPILGRGDFTFDLSNGRLWFAKDAIAAPVPQNRTGLELNYVFVRGDRALKVVAIRPRSPAASLIKDGLRIGALITQMDSKSAGDMDFWEVEQRLSGVYGEWVTLEWSTRRGLKIAPLRVR